MMRWLLLLAIALLLWRLLHARLLPRRTAAGRPGSDDAPFDPYAVLGVAPGATGDEITQAYRERLKEYHPDRVATLGPELRALAHRKTLDIQRAWQALRPR